MASRTAAHATVLRASLAAAGRKAASAARQPSRLTIGIAATAAAGALAVAVAAPWAAAASPELAAGHQAATSRTAAAHHATAMAAHHATAARKAASRPGTIYDSVTPAAIPAGKRVATYSDGPYQASPSSVSGHGKVLWIDVNGSNPRAGALDVEPGDATPAGAASWVRAKLTADPHSTAIVYTFKSAWGGVTTSIDALPGWMRSHVKYWIADPTGTPHILPGAAATQWYWGSSYDITAAHPGFPS